MTDTTRTTLLAVLFAVMLVALLGLAALAVSDSDEIEVVCAAEDEVLVEVKVDSFDLSEGEMLCVHIDELTS